MKLQGWAKTNASKKECKRGHLFTPENTYVRGPGKRSCRICDCDRHNRRYWKKQGVTLGA